ncbi:MAG: hypothetical protein ABUK01_05720 [Leptospirales bacterium]
MKIRYRSFEMPEIFSEQKVQCAQDDISDIHASGKSVMLSGSSEVFYLSHQWQADLVLRGHSVHVIDCAIRFNPFLLTEEAFRNSVSPEYLLSKVGIRRAFTPYQILDSAREALSKEALAKEDHAKGKADPGFHNSVYFFLAPCKQFFDGDVASDEGAFLLEKLVHTFRSFAKAQIPLVLIEKDRYRSPLFSSVYAKLEALSDTAWRLQKEEGIQGQKGRKNKESRYQLLRSHTG